MEGGQDLYNAVAKRTTHSSARRQEEMAQEELNKQLIGNLSSPAQAIPHSSEVIIERLTDKEIRGAGSGTDTDSAASFVETDWVIPDLRNTRLSDANPIPLDHEVTADQQNKSFHFGMKNEEITENKCFRTEKVYCLMCETAETILYSSF